MDKDLFQLYEELKFLQSQVEEKILEIDKKRKCIMDQCCHSYIYHPDPAGDSGYEACEKCGGEKC